MAGRLAVMDRGRIAQVGEAHEIYEHPRSRLVAGFIGIANILPAEDGRGWLALRPEKIGLFAERPATDRAVQGRVAEVAYEGDRSLYHVAVDGLPVMQVVAMNADRAVRPRWTRGAAVWLGWSDGAAQRLEE